MKRIFLIVLDSFGIGEMPDAANYGDEGSNTIGTVAKIPEFIASYGNNLKFTMDAKAPYFTYFLKKNSREKNVDARAVIEDFLNGVRENLKIAQDSVKKE